MSQWDVLGPNDFRKGVPTRPNSEDEDNSSVHHQLPPSSHPSLSLSRLAPHGVRRQRKERSPSDDESDRRPRYNPADVTEAARRRQEPLRQPDKPTRPASASSSQASSSKSSQQTPGQRVHFTPHLQRAQSLQTVTRVLPPISTFDNKPPRPTTNAPRGNGNDVHAFVPAPLAGCGMVASCPAEAHWAIDQTPARASEPNMPTERARTIPITMSAAGPTSVPQSSSGAPSSSTFKRFAIRTDLQFDKDSRSMTALMEVPGLTKSDIKISLDVCKFSGVQILSVTGVSQPEDGTWALQERKHGQLGRTMLVPPGTKPDDIVAELKNGILKVKVYVRSPPVDDRPIDIPIMD